MRESRDSIQDIWGPRTPHWGDWPARVDERVLEEPDQLGAVGLRPLLQRLRAATSASRTGGSSACAVAPSTA